MGLLVAHKPPKEETAKKKILSNSASPRLKREETPRIDNDSSFSKWQILIGPADWENYSLGKTERYRIHNLPRRSCPAVYELGIAASKTDSGREILKLSPHQVIVVYLGQADDVRSRLQQYGRAGSHLDHGNFFGISENNNGDILRKGPGLFKEIFAKGFPIIFRYALLESKKEAEGTEARLLKIYDYAWNKVANGSCRRDEILTKLDRLTLVNNPVANAFRKMLTLKNIFNKMSSEISIEAKKPSEGVELAETPDFNKASGVVKFVRSRPTLVPIRNSGDGDLSICGVTKSDGSVCRSKPLAGRKRCPEHKGWRIGTNQCVLKEESSSSALRDEILTKLDRLTLVNNPVANAFRKMLTLKNIFNKMSSEISIEAKKPSEGVELAETPDFNKASGVVKFVRSRPTLVPIRNSGDGDLSICGVTKSDGSVCRSKPLAGRKRCPEHKGWRIGTNRCVLKEESSSSALPEHSSEGRQLEGRTNVCGIRMDDGAVCMTFPSKGRKRCELHRGRRITN